MSRVTLLGVPYDASSSFQRGAAFAPNAIRDALRSASSNMWSESLVDLSDSSVLGDAGDVAFANDDPSECRAAIESRVRAELANGTRLISLGGDHSVTYPLLRGYGARSDVTLVQIDAHPDLYPEYEGDRYSHACPFARILEEGLVTRLVQFGIRAMSGAQRENVERYHVEQIDMRAWTSGVRPSITGPVYFSIDLDGIDPAFAPGVSHPEPGGLTVRDVVSIIQRSGGPIIGADVVELNPDNDYDGLTARVAAKLVKEVAARMVSGSGG